MTTPHAGHEIEGMRVVPGEGEPWATRLDPPHPPQVARAAGSLTTMARSRTRAYQIAYTLLDAGLLAPNPDQPPDHDLRMPHDIRWPEDEKGCPPNCPYREWVAQQLGVDRG